MKKIVATLGPKSLEHDQFSFLNENASILRVNGSWVTVSQIDGLRSKTNLPLLMDIPGDRSKINKKKSSNFSDDELIDLAIEYGFDYLGLSYVKSAQDIIDLKNKTVDSSIKIISKIETAEALENLSEIVTEGDIFLIDRGDLGIAIGFENVPRAQKIILDEIKNQNKKVIVATEMLMSTINSTKPNCSDVSDVYNALKQGADYVMLSEETAIGNPKTAVKIMKQIIESYDNEKVVFTYGAFDMLHPGHIRFLKRAKNLGDRLILGLVDDSSITKLKGTNRPIQSYKERYEILSSIKFIDELYLQETYDPVPLMKKLKIDILTKGDDWEKIPGESFANSNNIKVVKLSYSKDFSTSDQLNKIQNLSDLAEKDNTISESKKVFDQIVNSKE